MAYLIADPDKLPFYATELQQAIGSLMDQTGQSTCSQEKARLATLEMRARLAMKAWQERQPAN